MHTSTILCLYFMFPKIYLEDYLKIFFNVFSLGHPRFLNQQFAGMDYHSLAGRFLTEALNTNL